MTAPPDSSLMVTLTAGLDHAALDRLNARIHTDVDQGRYLGASVVVARGGLVGHRDTIGDVAPGRPAEDHDVYLLMSISKSFTATLVLRAIDQGRFTLDTRVAELLPKFAAGGKQRVTIHQLLTHTAGTYAGFAPPPPLTLSNDMGDLSRNVAAVAALPAAYTPGARVVYNPFASYAVLGQILVATDPAGRSFQAITDEDLFAPLGMAATSYGLRTNHPRRVPVSAPESHTSRAAMVALNSAIDERTEHPAGGAFGTADDLFRFAEMWRRRGEDGNHRVLSPALVEYATQNHTGELRNEFWDADREARDIPAYPANFALMGGYVRGTGHHLTPFGHTASPRTFGAVGGGSTMWMVDPERDLTVVFLSAGFLDGLDHFQRLQQLSDLALAACPP